jgi:hypothetical protein
MLPDHDLDVHADFARTSKNFQHATDGPDAAFWIARDFSVHNGAIEFREAHAAAHSSARCSRAEFLAKIGRKFFARRNQHFVRDARVIGQNVIPVRAVAEKSDERGMLPHDDFYDAAFCATVSAAALDARKHAIAMHGIGQVIAADEEIPIHARNRLIRYNKAVAIAMRNEAAGNQSAFARLFRRRSRSRRGRLRLSSRPCWRWRFGNARLLSGR